ncbi:hypothetical protein PAMC26510_32540 [Caballeronia sordidicola]|uniref:Uncharacterized protein n=1 Tax=Caballeronia sordidicola TaxID=196367 RepID=A0A242MIV2_CABSO|nr:hypothetical protein PAMC26510_32540 [Caballeronia sordidicola]OTP71237.1 hypothetical protein PAMC26577_25210 [Caballeronia sordidicola]
MANVGIFLWISNAHAYGCAFEWEPCFRERGAHAALLYIAAETASKIGSLQILLNQTSHKENPCAFCSH